MRHLTEMNRRRLTEQGTRIALPDVQIAAAGGAARPIDSGGGSIVVTLTGFGGAAGDVLKCVGGSWSYLTDADAGAFLVGLILAVNGDTSDASVLVYGTGALAGTQGTVFYAPHAAGAATTTRPAPETPPTPSPWERIVAIQVTAELRQVLQLPAWRLLAADDCADTPVTHYVPETTV